MLVLAPVMCIIAGIGVNHILKTYLKNLDIVQANSGKKKKKDPTYPVKNEVIQNLKPKFMINLQCYYSFTL